MNDQELCEAFGITLDQVAEEVARIEAGDYSACDFSRIIEGVPLRAEKTQIVSAKIGQSRVEAINRIIQDLGITRSEFIRRAIDHELMALA